MLIDVVIVILVLMLIGSFPVFPYSRNWGYYPTGGIGVILAIVVVLLLLNVF
jgi:low affinity Fe/Cu permease